MTFLADVENDVADVVIGIDEAFTNKIKRKGAWQVQQQQQQTCKEPIPQQRHVRPDNCLDS